MRARSNRFGRTYLLVALLLLTTAALGPGGTFADDNGNLHEPNIEAIFAAGITTGCSVSPALFCPSQAVTRGQMAAFLTRALQLPAPDRDYFADDTGSLFEDPINRLATAGITGGCGLGVFCPDLAITRGEMAAFLVRAYDYTVPGPDRFTDVENSQFEAEINLLAEAGVTTGCGLDRFCPTSPVLRDQMATFLARAELLEPIVVPAGCSILPADNIWNTRVDDLPLHSLSDQYVASIGASTTMHPDFGSGVWPPDSASPIGIPVTEVGPGQAPVTIVYTDYGDESDPGPFPIPPTALVEGGTNGSGDRHVIVVDKAACRLYELFYAWPQDNGSWEASSGAAYDLRSNLLRPAGWTSADAAGLPIYPGLVKYDEVAAGYIGHALRLTASATQRAYVWPARHFASSNTSLLLPPMGQRFRLEANFDISSFSPEIQVILTAFKQFGLILADNGSSWYVSGAPDPRWDNDLLGELKTIPGSAFEAVDTSSLQVSPDSGQAG